MNSIRRIRRHASGMPKQKKMNEKRARRYFEALIEANFKGGRDLVLHLTFDKNNYPESEEEAKKRVQCFLRNLNGKRKRRGLGNAKYIIVFEISKRGRFHFHIIMDGELDRDTVEATWKYGYCNADRLKADPKEGLTAIIPSRGLTRPWISEAKSSISRKRFNTIVELPEDSELFIAAIEKDNAGYFVQSVEKSYNEQTGHWYIFCRMRLKKNISTKQSTCVDKKRGVKK